MATQRYQEVLSELAEKIPAKTIDKATSLARVEELKTEREAALQAQEEAGEEITVKPAYRQLFDLLAVEEDADVRQAIQDEIFVFTAPLTDEEKDLFNYLPGEYVEDNPGYDEEGNWVSYVGSFPDPETGEYS